MFKKYLSLLLFLCILFRTGWLVYQNRGRYVSDYWTRYQTLQNVFGQSQYQMKAWKYWIPDETVYSYAGGAYLRGADPIIVESTQPPLGKYLISLSILVTGNENVMVSVFFVLFIIGIYLLCKQVTGSTVISQIVVLLALFERLFTDQITISPLLDIFLITFLVFGIITASLALEKRKPLILLATYACFGAALMTKVWLVGMVFVGPVTLYILLRYTKYYRYVIGGIIIVLGITLLSYVRMFMDGYNIIQVLLVQKWLYWYQNGKRSGLFTIWPLIFLNRWYVWWGNAPIAQDMNWSVSWPIVIGSGILAGVRILMKPFTNVKTSLYLTGILTIVYALFMSLGQASARYLLPLLPLVYILDGWILSRLAIGIPVMKKIL